MSGDTFKWAVGGFLLLLGILTKIAYSDPKFYTGFIDKVIDKVSIIIFLCSGSLWAGLGLSHSYVEKKLGLNPEQLKLYNTDYNDFLSYVTFVYFCSIVSLAYNFFLNILAMHKKKAP